ncbi:lipocalin family protein [Winogradskyella poriferorum]|mgnify:CR=1 FL=1|uniref:Lipocalin family protein n=1 Tax=Winogradskyella poriferorum TaxID=307627 RepID=A0ABU7W3Z2_9FLAO
MKKYGIILLILIFSCSKNPETLLTYLNGYWEIEEVTLENGTKKQYQFSETIDYISINDSLKGYRKKLKPGINDTYFTSDDAEAITLKIEDNQLKIYYKTAYAEWKETVLEASEKHLKVRNENNAIYLYKRYTPIHLDVE